MSDLPGCTCPCPNDAHRHVGGCSRCDCRACSDGFALGGMVAEPGFAPLPFQAEAPPELFAPRGVPVTMTPDLRRVLDLPRRPPLDPGSARALALVEIETERYALPLEPGQREVAADAVLEGRHADARRILGCGCGEIDKDVRDGKRSCITKLLPVQAWALREMREVGGIIASLPVGKGKTVIGILAPLALQNCRLALLLVPASLVEQAAHDYQLLAQHFRVPSIRIHASGGRRGPSRHIEGAPMLHVLPYTKLSSTTSSDWIERLQPDVILCDEFDALKDLTSARTMRVIRYFNRHGHRTRFAGWTGSPLDKSIFEIAHPMLLALRERSPLPLDPMVTQEWAGCLDANPNPSPPGALLQLCQPGESVRQAFGRRLAETPGVIISTSSTNYVPGTDVEIVNAISEREIYVIPDIVREALDKVRNFQRPDTLVGSVDDEELIDALAQAKCAQEVATGMFYRWIFPRGEPVALIKEWLAARKLWNRELRFALLEGEEFLDSAKLREDAARRAWGDDPPVEGMPDWRAQNWPRWRDVKDRVKPKTQAVRLHPFLVEDAAEWASDNKGIVWYGMTEFAQWLHEVSGLPLHAGGHDAERRLRNDAGDRSIIASIKSHGRGRNGLQFRYDRQLVANTPSSSRIYQQLLGRLDRDGQDQEVVQTHVYLHTPEVRGAFQQALRRSDFVRDILREDQKLLSGWGEAPEPFEG